MIVVAQPRIFFSGAAVQLVVGFRRRILAGAQDLLRLDIERCINDVSLHNHPAPHTKSALLDQRAGTDADTNAVQLNVAIRTIQ